MKRHNILCGDVRMKKTAYFKRATQRAKAIINDPQQASRWIHNAEHKASKHWQRLAPVWNDFTTLFSLIRACLNKDYPKTPWSSLVLAMAAVVYFVIPTDGIPDFIFALGLLDDVAIIGFVIKSIRGDIDNFRQWQAEQAEEEGNPYRPLPLPSSAVEVERD